MKARLTCFAPTRTIPRPPSLSAALRFRPAGPAGSAASKTKNVLLAASADGSIKHWHITSQRVLSKYASPDQIYAVDYAPEGDRYATAGRDKVVRVFDDEGDKLVVACRNAGFDTVGHSNRVFSVKFDPQNPTTLASGGWSNTVILHDTRTGNVERSFFGPHICGDAIDIRENLLLAGSWKPEKQLCLYDIRGKTTEPVLEVPWSLASAGGHSSSAAVMGPRGAPATLVYGAQFSSCGTYMAAGGSGVNEAKVWDCSKLFSGAAAGAASVAPTSYIGKQPAVISTISGLSKPVYSIHFHEEESLAVAGGDYVHIFDVAAAAAPSSAAAGAEAGHGGAVAAGSSGGAAGAGGAHKKSASFFDEAEAKGDGSFHMGHEGISEEDHRPAYLKEGGGGHSHHHQASHGHGAGHKHGAAGASSSSSGSGSGSGKSAGVRFASTGPYSAAEEAAIAARFGGTEEEGAGSDTD